MVDDEFRRDQTAKLHDPLIGVHVNNVMDWWQWWSINEGNLAKMALKYLAVPASSTPSEWPIEANP